jgi:hypothetical protein
MLLTFRYVSLYLRQTGSGIENKERERTKERRFKRLASRGPIATVRVQFGAIQK